MSRQQPAHSGRAILLCLGGAIAMNEHAIYVTTLPREFAVMLSERGNGSRCVATAKYATDAWEQAEKAAPEQAEYSTRPDWLHLPPGGAYVW